MSEEKFEQWAIVEIFGHQQYAGKVTEQTVGGCNFVRVDVPAVGEAQPFTKLFGQGAIYAMTIVTEETAKVRAGQLRKQPMDQYDVRQMVDKMVEQRIISSKPLEINKEGFFDDDEEDRF